MVLEHRGEHASQWAAIMSIAAKIGCTAQTLNNWVKTAEVDSGRKPGVTTDERERLKALERENRIVSFRLTIPDRPGVLGTIATRLGTLGANILEVNHRRLFLDVPAKGAKLDVTVETRDAVHAGEIMHALATDGYQPVRIEPGAAME